MILTYYLPFLGLALLANLGENRRQVRTGVYWVLAAFNTFLLWASFLALLMHLALSLGQMKLPPDLLPLTHSNWAGMAATLAATALLASLPLLSRIRRWLARYLSINPDSCVHTTALAFSVYYMGFTLLQLALIGDLQEVATSEGPGLSILDVLLSGLPLALLALVGVGALVRRNWQATRQRLGLTSLDRRAAGYSLALIIGFLLFDYVVAWLWQTLAPANYELIMGLTERLFGGLFNPWGALAVALSAGIGEELLFRGALQPRFGVVFTAFLFAFGHVQYAFSPAALEVFVIGLVLGLWRRRFNTTACILVHAGYNFLDLLVMPLFP